MSKNKFNAIVGLNGSTGTSNAIGDWAGLLNGTSGGSQATTTTNSSTTSLNSLNSKLSALQQERIELGQKIAIAEKTIAVLDSERINCKRTIGWNNSCLDQNTAWQNEQRALITSYQNRLAQIDLEIPKLQAEIAAVQKSIQDALIAEAAAAKAAAEAEATRLAAEAAKITAQAMANPENMQIKAQADIAIAQAAAAAQAIETEAKSEKGKLYLYLGAGLGALIIIVVAVMFILKK
jgi:chromosome segregation ATPase